MLFRMWFWFLHGSWSLAWAYICERLSSKSKMFSIDIYSVFRVSLRIFGPQHYAVGQLWIEYFLLMERQKNDYWEYIIEVNRMLFHWAKLRLFEIFNTYFIEHLFFKLDPKTYSDFNLGELISSFKKEPSGWAGNEKLFRTLIYDALNKDPSKR